jgi:branched-chain amino acid transport system substrate-binding protein
MTAQQINDIMKAQFTSMKFDGVTGTSMTWETTGMVSKDPRGMVIENGTYVGMD